MFEKAREEFDKGMPVISYIKKNYGFDSVVDFEAYVTELKEKADKYDSLTKEGKI